METPADRHALALFAPLGPSYDRVGAVLSFGQDPRWRRFLVSRDRRRRRPRARRRDGHRSSSPSSLLRDGHAVTGSTRARTCSPTARARFDAASSWSRRRPSRCPFADATFDHLTFTYLLRYVDEPGAVLRELARVVRPGERSRCSSSGCRAGLARRSGSSTCASASRWRDARSRPAGTRSAGSSDPRSAISGCDSRAGVARALARGGHRRRPRPPSQPRRRDRRLGDTSGP